VPVVVVGPLLVGHLFFFAPELLKGPRVSYTPASDVYAFGTVLWQVASHKKPFQGINEALIRSYILEGSREDFSGIDYMPDGYEHLIQLCWKTDPTDRPSLLNVIHKLIEIYNGEIAKQSQNKIGGQQNSS